MNININLIAERRARKMREVMVLRWSTMGVLFVILLMISMNVIAAVEMFATKRDIIALEFELKSYEGKRQELARIELAIAEKRPMVALLEQVRVSEGAWMTMLADFSHIIPHDVVIDNLSTTPSDTGVRLRVSGRALDETTVGEFMMALRQHTRWAMTPELGTVSAEQTPFGDKLVRFDLAIPVKGLFGGQL